MTFSATAAVETKESFGYQELFSIGGGSEDPTLDELIVILDGIDDPFVQTVFILHILMPAMVKVKEDNLDDLATSLETMAVYTTDLAVIQENFNELKDPESDFAGLAEGIVTDIDALLAKIESADSPLDESLETQIVTSLTAMRALVMAGGSTDVERGATINRLWDASAHEDGFTVVPDNPYAQYDEYRVYWVPDEFHDQEANPYYQDMFYDPEGKRDSGYHIYDHIWEWYCEYTGNYSNDAAFQEMMEDDTQMKEYLDDFNVTGTSLKSQSSLTQALVEHDGSEYNAFIALNKDMFKEFHNQVQAHSRALRNL